MLLTVHHQCNCLLMMFVCLCVQYRCSSTHGLTIHPSDGPALQCLYTGQKLNVSVVTDEWLHQGSIMCPSCDEICDVCQS